MLWYKSWLDTRWRFLIGLGVLMCSAAGIVMFHSEAMKLLPLVPTMDTSSPIGQLIKESAALMLDYRGYIWAQWFTQSPVTLGILFAVLLGGGRLFSLGFGGGTLFTLSLPVSRDRVLGVRAAVGLAELFVLSLLPSLLIPLLSPAIGESYGIGNALVHSLCLFVAGSMFFSLALLLSTVFSDMWSPLLIPIGIAVLVTVGERLLRVPDRFSVYGIMDGELFFRTGQLPWVGLIASAAAALAMIYGATIVIGRRDF
jgi:ABC-type transport system involved in multi-copper enzyme maturation permease subunit